MSALLDNVDPDGLLEYSVVYTDRSLISYVAIFSECYERYLIDFERSL